mgnify:FL=1
MELSVLKGVGPKRMEVLHKLDIYSLEDLIAFLPVKYRDLTAVAKLNAVSTDTPALFKVRCMQKPTVRYPRKNFTVTSCEVEDISGRAQVIWFNQPYMAQNIEDGAEIYLYGCIEIKQGRRRLMNPTIEHEDELCIVPVYRLPASCGMNQKAMRGLMRQAIEYCSSKEREIFPSDFRARHQLAERNFAITNIHFPQSETALLQARRRLCFEELLLVQLFIRLRKKKNEVQAGKKFVIQQEAFDNIINSLPYALTGAQKKCIEEIKRDVTSGKAMNRLVQGDVGCGKTIVAFLAMALAVQNGGQAALMAPTDILARQHYLQLCQMFGREKVSFLSGALSAVQRKKELERIQNGEAVYIVGTNALIQRSVEYQKLLLIITDEQHRFGVAQRARFFAKGDSPHTLVMSATPIPRTLSLIIFGDLDISVIDELPAGRQKVATSIIPKSREKDMLAYIRKELQQGRQAYFVCPLIEEEEESTLMSAEKLYAELSSGAFQGIPIALLHGKMSAEEKNTVMDAFAAGEVKALISTTVIEVGVNVKNAVIMVIYGAERFGLAQLHQLRGRVGRGALKSYCFMLTQSNSEETKERLEIMTKTNNGFEIAQRDFELRGPGDYLGKRQSGIAEARFSYALSNTLLLKETQHVLETEILPDEKILEPLTAYVNARFDKELEDIAYN